MDEDGPATVVKINKNKNLNEKEIEDNFNDLHGAALSVGGKPLNSRLDLVKNKKISENESQKRENTEKDAVEENDNQSDYKGGEEDITLDVKAMKMKMMLVQDRSTWQVSETDGKSINNELTQAAMVRGHVCEYCNYTAPKKYLLMRHMKSHSDDKPNTCSDCGKGCKTITS